MDALAAHLEKYPARRVDIEDRTDPRPAEWKRRKSLLVFTTERGEAIRRAAWASVWENLGRAADKALRKQHEGAFKSWERRGPPEDAEPTLRQVPDEATMHDLRHFYASVLIKHRESVKTVQKWLGHAKPSITLNTYTHLWPDEEDTTRAAIEAALGTVPSMRSHGPGKQHSAGGCCAANGAVVRVLGWPQPQVLATLVYCPLYRTTTPLSSFATWSASP